MSKNQQTTKPQKNKQKNKQKIKLSQRSRIYGTSLVNIADNASIGHLWFGDEIFKNKNGEIIKFTNNDRRYNFAEMVKQVGELLKVEPYSNALREYTIALEPIRLQVLRILLRCDGDFNVKISEKFTTCAYDIFNESKYNICNIEEYMTFHRNTAKIYTPYHVHFIVNWVTKYILSLVDDPNREFWFIGKIKESFEGYPKKDKY